MFAPYIAEFMAVKIHASGFSSDIRGDRELEEQFIKECKERFGIVIDREKMAHNKGLRALAKLLLNNLWGRFSMRNGLAQVLITKDPVEFAEMLDDRSKEIMSIDTLDNENIMISYVLKKEWVEEHGSSNIVISLWTTSEARLRLLKLMQTIVRSGGELLYTDTDSVIFAHDEGSCPLSVGPHLGDLTDEYPRHKIKEFVCGGAKQYSLELENLESGEIHHEIKLRGICLNHDVTVNQHFRHNTFRDRVLTFAETGRIDPIHIHYPNFLRPSIARGEVTSVPLNKLYRPFVGKGIVGANYQVVDFGHIRDV